MFWMVFVAEAMGSCSYVIKRDSSPKGGETYLNDSEQQLNDESVTPISGTTTCSSSKKGGRS